MRRGRRIAIVAALALGWCLASASPGMAAGPYYAAPTSSGTANCSSPANACTVNTAVSTAAAGETVLLAAGTYELTANLDLFGSLVPQVAGTRPILHTTLGYVLATFHPTASVRDLRLEFSGLSSTTALNLQMGATAQRVEVLAQGSASPFGALVSNGATISDSSIASQGTGSVAIASSLTGGTVRNVTAVATGTDSDGFYTNPSYMGATPSQTVTVQNSVIRGDRYSFDFYGDAASGGHTVNVNVDHGNYSTTNSVGLTNAFLNDPGGPQTTPGLFSNPGLANFHELTGSVTINAGAPVAGLSATDLDGEARTQGGAPDIGADEFVPPPVAGAPSGTTPAPTTPVAKRTKCKKRKKPASAAKKCKKKRH